jgi:hypothetical protein
MLGKNGSDCDNNTYQYDYCWTAGDTESIAIRLKDEDGVVVPINVGKVQLRTDSTSSTVVIEKEGTYDSENGVFTVEFSSTDTQSIIGDNQKFVIYKYDLELLLGNGDTYTPIEGSVKIKQSVTR